jgi:hypothetical protein
MTEEEEPHAKTPTRQERQEREGQAQAVVVPYSVPAVFFSCPLLLSSLRLGVFA